MTSKYNEKLRQRFCDEAANVTWLGGQDGLLHMKISYGYFEILFAMTPIYYLELTDDDNVRLRAACVMGLWHPSNCGAWELILHKEHQVYPAERHTISDLCEIMGSRLSYGSKTEEKGFELLPNGQSLYFKPKISIYMNEDDPVPLDGNYTFEDALRLHEIWSYVSEEINREAMRKLNMTPGKIDRSALSFLERHTRRDG